MANICTMATGRVFIDIEHPLNKIRQLRYPPNKDPPYFSDTFPLNIREGNLVVLVTL